MTENGDQVAHGARGDEKRILLAHQARREFLQAVYRGVFAVYIISHFGAVHGFTHLRRGLGNCI